MRNHKIYVNLSDTEYTVIRDKADKLGLSISSYLRLQGLTQKAN